MGIGRLIENMRALLFCINSSVGISPICTNLRDHTGNIMINVDQEEFPEVDCNEVFPNIYL